MFAKDFIDISLSSALAFLGFLLFLVGVYRLGDAVAHSALFHASLGLVLLLIYSEHARLYLLRLLPRSLLIYLYRKSLLDVLVEPSPALKAYTVVALSAVLSDDELRRLAESLPRECDFVRRPGLVHLLPGTLHRALYSTALQRDLELEQAEELAQEGSLVGEVAEADEGDFFVAPRFLMQGRDDGLVAGGDEDGDEDEDDGAEPAMPVATHIVAAAASAPAPSSSPLSEPSEFERLFTEIVSRRARDASQQVFSTVSRQASVVRSDLIWFIITGGTASDEQVVAAFATCGSVAAGVSWLLSSAAAAGVHLEEGGRSGGALMARLQVVHPVVRAALQVVTGAATRAAAVCGAVLFLRGVSQSAAPSFDGEPHPHNHSNHHQLGIATRRRGSALGVLNRAWARVTHRCVSLFRDNPVYASAVSASLFITALLAWSLKTRWRRMKWLALVVLSRIQSQASALREQLG